MLLIQHVLLMLFLRFIDGQLFNPFYDEVVKWRRLTNIWITFVSEKILECYDSILLFKTYMYSQHSRC